MNLKKVVKVNIGECDINIKVFNLRSKSVKLQSKLPPMIQVGQFWALDPPAFSILSAILPGEAEGWYITYIATCLGCYRRILKLLGGEALLSRF